MSTEDKPNNQIRSPQYYPVNDSIENMVGQGYKFGTVKELTPTDLPPDTALMEVEDRAMPQSDLGRVTKLIQRYASCAKGTPKRGDVMIFLAWDMNDDSICVAAAITHSPHDPAPAREPTYWITQRSAGELTGWYGLEEIDPSVATDPKSRGIVPRTWDHMACIAMLNCDYGIAQIPAPQVGDIVWVCVCDVPSSYHIVTKTPFDPSFAMGVASSGG